MKKETAIQDILMKEFENLFVFSDDFCMFWHSKVWDDDIWSEKEDTKEEEEEEENLFSIVKLKMQARLNCMHFQLKYAVKVSIFADIWEKNQQQPGKKWFESLPEIPVAGLTYEDLRYVGDILCNENHPQFFPHLFDVLNTKTGPVQWEILVPHFKHLASNRNEITQEWKELKWM